MLMLMFVDVQRIFDHDGRIFNSNQLGGEQIYFLSFNTLTTCFVELFDNQIIIALIKKESGPLKTSIILITSITLATKSEVSFRP